MCAATWPCPRDTKLGWRRNHDLNVQISKSTPNEVCLFGASIIGGLERYPHIWRKFFCGTLRAVNFGIGGDRSQHALWRAINGEIPSSARCVVVNIGNNNLDRDPPTKIANATIAIGRKFQEALPEVKVLLVGLLPRDEGYSFRRDRQQEVNTCLRNYCQREESRVFFYLPPDNQFAPGANGFLNKRLYYNDLLHLSRRGNELFGRLIYNKILNMLYRYGGRALGTIPQWTPMLSVSPKA